MKTFTEYLLEARDLTTRNNNMQTTGNNIPELGKVDITLIFPKGIKINMGSMAHGFAISGKNAKGIKMVLVSGSKKEEMDFNAETEKMLVDLQGRIGNLTLKQGDKEIKFNMGFGGFSYDSAEPVEFDKPKNKLLK